MITRHSNWWYLGCMSMLLLMPSISASAETVLVVSEDSQIHKLSRHEITDIFMGNNKNLPQFGRIVPVDRAQDTLREEFYKDYLGKSLPQVKAHWAKIIFTGRGHPPPTVSDVEELKGRLKSNPNAVSYLERSMVDETLRIVKLE